EKFNHKIDTFVIIDDEIRQVVLNKLVDEKEYINMYNNLLEENLIQNISTSSKKINQQLRNVDSQKRPILLSACMISLIEHENNDIDNSFIRQYKSWKSRSIAQHIPVRVEEILKAEGIPSEKRDVIKAELGFMNYDKSLTETKVLIDILDELKTNVISKFSIVSNYDIIGKFYEEFLRYAGVNNVKKGIVLTPYHITTLFTDLIPVGPEDVFIDPACGTGAFLISGMNKLLKIHKKIQNKKTAKLLEKIKDIKDFNILNAINVITNINEEFSQTEDHYNYLVYTDAEKNSLIEAISSSKIFEKDHIESVIIQVRNLQAETIYNKVKSEQLIGYEVNPTMYSLAISNMMFRGDGKSQIFYEDYFSEKADTELRRLKTNDICPTIGFVNPPYGGKDNSKNPTKKEIQFLQKLLQTATKYVIMISPLSTLFKDDAIRNNILKENTLKYVINMPKELFEPNAATNTAISVFEVGVPHDNKKVIFYNLKDDGFVLSKSKGRTNAYGKWDKIRNELLDKLFNPHKQENLIELNKSTYFLEHEVFENSEWVIQEYAKTDYDNLSYKDFVKTIKDFIVYRVKKELDIINIDLNELTMAEILASNTKIDFREYVEIDEKINVNEEGWQYIYIKDIFPNGVNRCKCSTAGDLLDGDEIYYLGAKKKDGGLIRKVAYDETLVTEGNCIGFITDGDGSIGYHNYIDLDEFIGTTNLSVGYNPNINKYSALFLVTILDLEREKYSFGRKYRTRIPKTKIKLPVKKNQRGEYIKDKNNRYIPDWEYMEEFIKKLSYSNLL
ncbi:TPA: N-6 DNA methylase, partial [Staphylococcus pseudintermedius]|nr:N-6 DNA methylase [Staphylococcus pseudintermedius]